MPQLAVAIPFITAAVAVAGVGLSVYSAIQQSKAAKEISAAQKKQEAIQKSAMSLENRRRRLEAIRQNRIARSSAIAAAANQGALGGSGLAGGLGQIEGQTNAQLLGLSENYNLGLQNFSANSAITSAKADYATAGAFGSLGGTLINSLGPINSLSQGFGSSKSSSGYNTAFGTGTSKGAVY